MKILVTGACGQIGTELTQALRIKFGKESVIASDISDEAGYGPDKGLYERLDVMNRSQLEQIIAHHQITLVYHLAAMLSARGEQNPLAAWQLNMDSLLSILELSKKYGFRVFWPSSIAVFGAHVSTTLTPQHSILEPSTVYGISKAAGENWCKYYFEKFGVDVRSLRYPGLISHSAPPGGGTTDYAVDIFHHAVKGLNYTCYLQEDTFLPMMYMPDAIRATLELMDAPADRVTVRTSYNLNGFSFCPADLAKAIAMHLPNFNVTYNPDHRQQIADSWPQGVDDLYARRDWGWKAEYDLPAMTKDMLKHLMISNYV